MITFGIVGKYQQGKSTLINCLFGRPITTIGKGSATTHAVVRYKYGDKEHIEYQNETGKKIKACLTDLQDIDSEGNIGCVDVYLKHDLLKEHTIIDLPGLFNDKQDNALTLNALSHCDCAIVIISNMRAISGELSEYARGIELLQNMSLPYYLILNCKDQANCKWDPDDREQINYEIAKSNDEAVRFYPPLKYPFEKDEYVIVNLIWYWFGSRILEDNVLKRYLTNLREYDFNIDAEEAIKLSNFSQIQKIFSMENDIHMELQKRLTMEIKKLRNELCPIGTIQTFAFNAIPEGWLSCDGAIRDIEEYPELFQAIGTIYGGDGETTFAVPDLRGRFVRGLDEEGINDTDEREIGSIQEDAIQGHKHELYMSSDTTDKDGSHDHYVGYDKKKFISTAGQTECYSVASKDDPHVLTYGDSTRAIHQHKLPKIEVREVCDEHNGIVNVSNETRPKNIALLYCIKAK